VVAPEVILLNYTEQSMPTGSQIVFFFSERVVNVWNSLDDQSLTTESLNSLKSDLSRLRRQSMGLFMDNFVR